jgi:hypothetical protein
MNTTVVVEEALQTLACLFRYGLAMKVEPQNFQNERKSAAVFSGFGSDVNEK